LKHRNLEDEFETKALLHTQCNNKKQQQKEE